MQRDGDLAGGILKASASAGAAFLLATLATIYCAAIPHPIMPSAADLAAILLLALMATIVGFVISALPNILGSTALALLGNRFGLFRSPLIWAATGAAIPAAVVVLVGAGAGGADLFPLCATGAFCAWLCRRSLRWRPDDPAVNAWRHRGRTSPDMSQARASIRG